MVEGWICLYRKFLDWQWYKDVNTKSLFIHLLLNANWEDKKWKDIIIKRGQLVTSIAKLAKEIEQTTQQTRNSLNKLKTTNEITIKTTNKYTLITIEKYNNFQSPNTLYNKQNNKQDNKQRTNKEQTNQQANQQQLNNKQYNNITNKKENIKEKSFVDGEEALKEKYINMVKEISQKLKRSKNELE